MKPALCFASGAGKVLIVAKLDLRTIFKTWNDLLIKLVLGSGIGAHIHGRTTKCHSEGIL
jgi:hypothetical protein